MRNDHEDTQNARHPAAFEIIDGGRFDGSVRLSVAGELDLASCEQLAARLEELAASQTTVHLDISGLTFIDSSGLAVLIRHARHARRDGWTLQIGRDGVQRQVERVIELIGADEILWPPRASGADVGAAP